MGVIVVGLRPKLVASLKMCWIFRQASIRSVPPHPRSQLYTTTLLALYRILTQTIGSYGKRWVECMIWIGSGFCREMEQPNY
jgi:hypothetical protein